MNPQICYSTSEYGKRVLLSRVFVQGVEKEHLALLAQMMNDFPQSKKDISDYADGEITFRCYCFADGFIFEGRLTQAQSKSLAYLFSDPYRSGEEIFADVFAQGFIRGEKELALSKERLLLESSAARQSSYRKSQQLCSVPYASLQLKAEEIKTTKLSDLEKVFAVVSQSNVGSLLTFGMEKTNQLKRLVNKENSLPKLKRMPLLSLPKSELEDESVTYIISHQKLTSIEERQALMASFVGLVSYLRESLTRLVSVDFDARFGVLDEQSSYLTLTVEKGKLDSLVERLPMKKKESPDKSFYQHPEQLVAEAGMHEIQLRMETSAMIDELLSNHDLGFEYHLSSVSAEQIKTMASSFMVEDMLQIKE